MRNNPRMKAPPAAAWALALLLLPCAGGGQAAGPQAGVQRSSYWRERNAFFQAFGRTADVAMIGDSLTDGAEWSEIFPGRSIVNRGIDGDTTRGVLARLDTILAAPPKRAFVMLGINDFADGHRAVEAVFHDYRALVGRLQAAGVRVFVQSTLPCHPVKAAWKSCRSLNPRVAQLNARLATLASETVTFVPLSGLVAADGGLRGELTFDGVHLNGQGYLLWRDAIAPFMP
jgi:lysophospholipase L1-like esterase